MTSEIEQICNTPSRPSTLTVGIVQLNTRDNLSDAADAVEKAVREAAARGAELVVTPEYSNLCHGDAACLHGLATTAANDPLVQRAQAMADELKIRILLGSVVIARGDGKFANRSILVGPDGEVAATYDKIHLFELDRGDGRQTSESAHFTAGDRAVVASTPWGGLGLTICYDLRFPYLHRALAQQGASLIAAPTAFTRATGAAHWESLLRARAIETGAFILAPAQGGAHPGNRFTWGRSMIVDPWGTIVALIDGDIPGVAVATLQMNAVTRARAALPGWAHNVLFKASAGDASPPSTEPKRERKHP